MHQTAKLYAKTFFEVYLTVGAEELPQIVEVGSLDVNGSLREVAPQSANYIGLDFEEGRGVDIILDDPYNFPLADNSADVVVASSCFEHSEFYWLTFLECCRIVKPGGLIYLNAPSNGAYHRYPIDAWRFYPDAGLALEKWAIQNKYKLSLLESFIGARSEEDIWNDFVAIYQLDSGNTEKFNDKIHTKFDGLSNVYSGTNFINTQFHSYEKLTIDDLVDKYQSTQEQLNSIINDNEILKSQNKIFIDVLEHYKRALNDQFHDLEKIIHHTESNEKIDEELKAMVLNLAEKASKLR